MEPFGLDMYVKKHEQRQLEMMKAAVSRDILC